MCMCDKDYGEIHLPHQLSQGSKLDTQERIPVTIGFQKNICQECRGEKVTAAPVSSMPGRTTKVTRFYWREITFETTKRFYASHPELDPTYLGHLGDEFSKERKAIEKEVIEELKSLHEKNPKYDYTEITQREVIDQTSTEVILVKAKHVKRDERKVGIEYENEVLKVEQFAMRYFENRGYKTIETESVPFHVLFGIFMWILMEDPDDPNIRWSSFGNRTDFDMDVTPRSMVRMQMPDDFGCEGYYFRREAEIKEHIESLDDVEWLFDYWFEHSNNLRQYLWAHRQDDVDKAKKILKILGKQNLKKVLHFLIRNYWKNFCGWPDLLVYKDGELIFVEVKSSNDKLSEDQKNWLIGNYEHMHFDAKIFKVGKAN